MRDLESARAPREGREGMGGRPSAAADEDEAEWGSSMLLLPR